MNILVLRPGSRALNYALFTAGRRTPARSGRVADGGASPREGPAVIERLARVRAACSARPAARRPEAIAVRVAFGGAQFKAPAPVTDAVIDSLAELAPGAPLHLPALLLLLAGCRDVFPGVPTVLVFETAFFAELPLRERGYGMNPGLDPGLGLRRYGYHGIFHEAAARLAAREMYGRGGGAAPRTLSICLEPQPEIAAVIGRRPVMVTGGSTPLEGLPGRTSCGELDPGIVLHLARKLRWGPEQINQCLTRESGLRGLTGRVVSLETVFRSDADGDEALRLAREIMRYRILLASGAALAAMGAVDQIVFSGRGAKIGATLGPWLADRLAIPGRGAKPEIPWTTLRESLDRLIADAALPIAVRQEGAVKCPRA